MSGLLLNDVTCDKISKPKTCFTGLCVCVYSCMSVTWFMWTVYGFIRTWFRGTLISKAHLVTCFSKLRSVSYLSVCVWNCDLPQIWLVRSIQFIGSCLQVGLSAISLFFKNTMSCCIWSVYCVWLEDYSSLPTLCSCGLFRAWWWCCLSCANWPLYYSVCQVTLQ